MVQKFLKDKKHLLLALTAVAAVVTGLLLCYYHFRPQPSAGNKKILVDVVYEDSSKESFSIQTDALYLEQALEDAQGLEVEGSRSEQFGLMIETINGVTAIYDKDHAYWSIELNGTACNYGVSQQPIQDNEHYQFVYTVVDR